MIVPQSVWGSGSLARRPDPGLAVDEPDDVSFLTVCPRSSSGAYHAVYHNSELSQAYYCLLLNKRKSLLRMTTSACTRNSIMHEKR
jgi:hypothetical protein